MIIAIFSIVAFFYLLPLGAMETPGHSSSSALITQAQLPSKPILFNTKDMSHLKLEQSTLKLLYENSAFIKRKLDECSQLEKKEKSTQHLINLEKISHLQLMRQVNLINWTENKDISKESYKQREDDLEGALALEIKAIVEPYTNQFMEEILSETEQFKKNPQWATNLKLRESLHSHLINTIIDSTRTTREKYSPIEKFRQLKANAMKPLLIEIPYGATQIATNCHAKQLAVGNQKGAVHLFSLPDGIKERVLKTTGAAAHSSEIICLVYHPTDQKMLLSSCAGSKVSRWNTHTGELITTFNRNFPLILVSALFYDAGNEQIISGGSTGNIHIWNNKLAPQMQSADIANFPIRAIAHNQKNKTHYASDGKEIKTVQLKETGNHVIETLKGELSPLQLPYIDHIMSTAAKKGSKEIPELSGLPNPDLSLGQFASISPGKKKEQETTIDIRCNQSKARKFSLVLGTKENPGIVKKIIFSAQGEALIVQDNHPETIKLWNIKNFNNAYCRLSLPETLFLYAYLVKNEKDITEIEHLRPIAKKFGLIDQDDEENNNNNNAPISKMEALNLNTKS
jgi:WD40 repeat protein